MVASRRGDKDDESRDVQRDVGSEGTGQTAVPRQQSQNHAVPEGCQKLACREMKCSEK